MRTIIWTFLLAVATAGASTTWPALDASDQLLYKTIHAPRVVAEQPAHTHKEMVVMPDGEIRYYGRAFVEDRSAP